MCARCVRANVTCVNTIVSLSERAGDDAAMRRRRRTHKTGHAVAIIQLLYQHTRKLITNSIKHPSHIVRNTHCALRCAALCMFTHLLVERVFMIWHAIRGGGGQQFDLDVYICIRLSCSAARYNVGHLIFCTHTHTWIGGSNFFVLLRTARKLLASRSSVVLLSARR